MGLVMSAVVVVVLLGLQVAIIRGPGSRRLVGAVEREFRYATARDVVVLAPRRFYPLSVEMVEEIAASSGFRREAGPAGRPEDGLRFVFDRSIGADW